MNKALNKKMDHILELEEKGVLKTNNKSRALRKLFSNKLAIVGFIVFGIIMILCYFPFIFTKWDPNEFVLADKLLPPFSKGHFLGTDQIGRDVWARTIYGGRISILIGLGGALGAAVIGVAVGTITGYKGGICDTAVLKLSEVLMCFPQIILVSILVSVLGPSMWNIIFIFIFTGWPSAYRMTRAQMLSIRENDYINALKAFGVSSGRIAYVNMLPNAIGPIFVNITLNTAACVLQEAALSFISLGVPLRIATWGNMINIAQNFTYLIGAYWIWLPSAILLTLFILAINFIGDGLRDSTDSTQVG